jgi:N-acetylmuramoyl-L-alanine amidase
LTGKGAKFLLILLFCFVVFALPGQNRTKTYTIEETLSELGAVLRWDPFFSSGVLSFRGDSRRLNFYSGAEGEKGPVLIDGRDILTLALPYTEKGILRFPEAFVVSVRHVFSPVLRPSPEEDKTRLRIAAIIIDPGHGGKDSGAVGTHVVNGKTVKTVEKDITLHVSSGLFALLRAAYPDKRILMTRSGDTYPSLEERVASANSVSLKENEAIIYVSVHANASLNKSARGYEVWYLTPETRRTLIDKEKYADSAEVIPILNAMREEEFTYESIRIARLVLGSFNKTLGNRIPSRGLKAENWYVVRNARMPSILVELGFVTNPDDALLMTDPAYLKNFSEALYKGIADFVVEFEQSGGYIAP